MTCLFIQEARHIRKFPPGIIVYKLQIQSHSKKTKSILPIPFSSSFFTFYLFFFLFTTERKWGRYGGSQRGREGRTQKDKENAAWVTEAKMKKGNVDAVPTFNEMVSSEALPILEVLDHVVLKPLNVTRRPVTQKRESAPH